MEILSPTTERTERNEKSAACRHIDSLQKYLLVTQDQRRVEIQRREGGCKVEVIKESGRIRLDSLGLEIDFAGLPS